MNHYSQIRIPPSEGIGKPNEIGKRLRQARKNRSEHTQSDLGMYVGVDRKTIARYEQGTAKVPSNVLLKVSELYDVSILWLLGIDEKEH